MVEPIPEFSFQHKLLLDKTLTVILVYGYSMANEKQYAYVAVPGNKLAAFGAKFGQPDFRVQEFGTIITWGTGDPTPETMQQMEQDYGVKHQDALVIAESTAQSG